MPTSTYSHIPTLVVFLQKIMPASILDVGVGNGKMGFIARDLLDVMLGQRHRREDWKVRIDGIEIFSDYIQAHQKAIYDEIFIGDAFEIIDTLRIYDIIILGDVLEHFEKEKAWQFLDKCSTHCNYMIISIPLGEKWTQPPIYDNPNEEHLSFWSYEEFDSFVIEKELFFFKNIGEYGCLLINKEDYLHHRVREKADTLFSEGKEYEAITYMEKSLVDLPPNMESEFILIDLLLKNHQMKNAINHLKMVKELFPEDISAKNYLETLMEKLGATDASRLTSDLVR